MARARDVAVKVLDRVEQAGAYASAVLEAEMRGLGDPREAALATELVLGVLRNRPWLDRLLHGVADRGLAGIDPHVLDILRVAAYQIAFLERIPSRAAVSEAVNQTKAGRAERLSGLVNALLRKLAGQDPPLLPPAGGDSLDELALRGGLPTWIVKRLVADHGDEATRRMVSTFNDHSPRTMRVNLPKITPAQLAAGGASVQVADKLLPWYVDVGDREAARSLEADGHASYQDVGSGLVVAALDPQPGDEILDACAGRGGKTATMLAVVGGAARVTACDRQGSKLERLQFELEREGFAAQTRVLDFTMEGPDGSFDRVLVDAPCSGSGTMGRRPEIRWRLKPGAVKSLVGVQRVMLDQAAGQVKKGGRLVYAVCSVFAQESSGHLKAFFKRNPGFRRVQEPPEAWPDSVPWNDGVVLVDPGLTGTDGYGILCLRRKK